MENILELGQSYSVDYLLEYLSQNNHQNAFLGTANMIDMLSLPRDKKYVVYDIQYNFLHRFSPTKPNSHIIDNNVSTIYHIKPE